MPHGAHHLGRDRRPATLATLVLMLAFGAGCGGADPTAAPGPATTATVTATTPPREAPVSQAGVPGTYVPTSMGPVARQQLPPAFQQVDSLAGGDPTEAACIRHGIAASLGPGEDPPEARPGVAGTTVVECLPPAKLAAALTDRLREPALGLGLADSELACVHANLASSAASPDYTVLVGGLALGDPAAVRLGGAVLDRACRTHLSTP